MFDFGGCAQVRRSPLLRTGIAAAVLLALVACGGGGGGGKSADGTANVVDTGPVGQPTRLEAESHVEPSCSDCAAIDRNTYAGTGIGIWHTSNTDTAARDVKVAIGGLANNDVTLIFTNESASDVAMAGIVMNATNALFSRRANSGGAAPVEPSAKAKIDEFNRAGWATLLGKEPARRASSFGGAPLMATVGITTRVFNHHDGSARTTILKKTSTQPDGVAVNVWVETSEATETRVSSALVDQLASSFTRSGGVYDMLKDVGGALWGSHSYPELITGGAPIDIVVLNLQADSAPFGEMGYFYSINNFSKAYAPESNESVSLYLDSETMYLAGARGMEAIVSTMAHEGMHMSNFYRRGVKTGPAYQFDTWLDEMSAMMMEDVASARISATYNTIRDMRIPQYLQYANFNCSVLEWNWLGAPCDSYAVTGSLGGFLLRQMGIPFFGNVLRQPTTDSHEALNAAIKAFRPHSGIGEELRKFAVASIASLPAASAPAGFGFPTRVDGDYSIAAINAEVYKPSRMLPTSVPATLRGYANFPVVRQAVSGAFQETVRVPAGVSLTVVVN